VIGIECEQDCQARDIAELAGMLESGLFVVVVVYLVGEI
jgi:hypothetical protein